MKFRLVRYFSITSVFAFILVSVTLLFLQREAQTKGMIEQEEHNNINITRIISNSISKEFDFFIHNAIDIPPEELKHHTEVERLKGFLTSYFDGLDVVEVTLYNLQGNVVFSTDTDQIGENHGASHTEHPSLLSALNHKAASTILLGDGSSDGHEEDHGDEKESEDHSEKSDDAGHGDEKESEDDSEKSENNNFDKDTAGLDIVSTYTPIYKHGSRELKGVLLINSDISHFLQDIHASQIIVLTGVMGVLGLLFIALLLIVRRASKIIESQGEENEKSKMLLAESEKMASLGNMVAAVAHELNTPLAFTSNNVELVEEAISNLRLPVYWGNSTIDAFKKSDNNSIRVSINREKTKAALTEYSQGFGVDDMSEMLNETKNGLNQMSELVMHLKNFTRIDRSPVDKYDLNKGLETVLYIAKSVIPVEVSVVKDLGDVPMIECMPSQLNQVFMNLITNAAQAVDKVNGTITVKSSSLTDKVRVEVIDNGKGIAAEDMEHIFEAYYTTKGIDEGTGLGLSIVKKMIEEHSGTIRVNSKVGFGTTFIVDLPLEGIADKLEAA